MKQTKDSIIAELVVEKVNMAAELTEARSVLREIKHSCYCIGGPLNDNILNFNKDQMEWVYKKIVEPISQMVSEV